MSRASVIFKRIGRLLKFLIFCIIFAVCILLLWRVFSTGIPKEIKGLEPNDRLSAAYAEQGESLVVFDQVYDDITRAERNAGYFGVPQVRFIPAADQAQLVFRYNNSTIKALADDYALPSIPSRDEHLFDLSLVLYIDLTPNDKEDNYEKNGAAVRTIRVQPTDSGDRASSTLYNFYRYTFDFTSAAEPVDLSALLESGTLIAIHAEVRYVGDLDYEKTAYGALCIYDYRREDNAVELTKSEKEALAG